MLNTFLVRSKIGENNFLNEFLEKNEIGVGYSSIGDLKKISKPYLIEQLKKDIDAEDGRKINTTLSFLWIFSKEMQIGDFVIVPDGDQLHVGKITSNYRYELPDDDSINYYCHKRSVVWLENKIIRHNLSDDFRQALQNRRSIGRLSLFSEELKVRLKNVDIKIKSTSTMNLSITLNDEYKIKIKGLPNKLSDDEYKLICAEIKKLYTTF
jgi:predicted Mrr-cat superfamily restriction endonuclease